MSDDSIIIHLERLNTIHGVFYAPANDLITKQLLDFGAHTRNELAMVLDHVHEGDVVVDIGAHIGTYAVPIARKLGPRGKLLAIEGSPDTYAILQRNVGVNGLADRIQTACNIVGQGVGQHLKRVDVSGNTGAGYYIPDTASADFAVDAQRLICGHGFARVGFLKIDAEGMEGFILRSVAPLIEMNRPKLYIEIAARQLERFGTTVNELNSFLSSFGYRFFRNTGHRNSANDLYEKTEIATLDEGGGFFDLLALPD